MIELFIHFLRPNLEGLSLEKAGVEFDERPGQSGMGELGVRIGRPETARVETAEAATRSYRRSAEDQP